MVMSCRGIHTALTARRPAVRYAIVANKFQRCEPYHVRWIKWLSAIIIGLFEWKLGAALRDNLTYRT